MKTKNKQRSGRRIFLFAIIFLIALSNQVIAQGEIVGSLEATVCCEETNSGLFCQDVPESYCESGARSFPTACSSTSFCKPGFCFDSSEGTCLGNVPQQVCNSEGGTWTEEKPAQCELGCCIIGDQGLFSTLTRCKKVSSFYGVETNYDSTILEESACILIASSAERGACVFEKEFEKTCKMTTRAECTPENIGVGSGEVSEGVDADNLGLLDNIDEVLTSPGGVVFNPGLLCSAEILGTNCGQSEQTTCLDGKEEIYFVDTCGNPSNIYDASKLRNDEYWTYIKDKSESCNPERDNVGGSCGNCNYLLGSICRNEGGENACVSLNCVEEDGRKRLHGESWCQYDEDVDFAPRSLGTEQSVIDEIVGQTSEKFNSVISQSVSNYASGIGLGKAFYETSGGKVGSRYYRNVCINGEITVEPCADFRQEECIENIRETELGEFSEAACRVNRWQDCTAQKTKFDCLNNNARDCKWLDGIGYILMGGLANGSSIEKNSIASFKTGVKEIEAGRRDLGACVPEIPPGLRYWEGEEAAGICAQANALCPVTYEKGVLDDEWECVKNCECLPGGELEATRAQLCMALGDCGPKTNFVDDRGRGEGYAITKEKLKKDDK